MSIVKIRSYLARKLDFKVKTNFIKISGSKINMILQGTPHTIGTKIKF